MDKINVLKEKALNLPINPGVYLMLNKKGEIIYIGKAKNLKNRVLSYFREDSSHTDKVKKLVENIEDLNFYVTDTEFEALVLECSLIKEYEPKYNILLKDSKGYKFIKITNENYPKIIVCSKKANDGSEYIGPYVSSFSVKQAVEEVNKIFMLPTCKTNFNLKKRKRPCLNFYIKKCIGVCQKKISEKEYKKLIEEAINYIKKGDIIYLANLKKQMEKSAKEEDFEQAIKYRDKIKLIEKMHETQKVYLNTFLEADVIAFSRLNDKICFVVLKFKRGRIYDKEEFIFKETTDINTIKEEFIERYYYKKGHIPKYILLDFKLDNIELYEKYLQQQYSNKIYIKTPKKGILKKLTNLAYENSRENLKFEEKSNFKENKTLLNLKKILNLKVTPNYIEAYDISNIGDENIVGCMVVFKDATPYKRNYRKFRIKTIMKRNDYGSMQEMISRRIEEFKKKKDESFKISPDLILIDGGKGHLEAVAKIFEEKNFKVPLFGLVKDNKHRTRAIITKKETISIDSQKDIFLLLTRIQDEVHRFTISYQRKLHNKKSLNLDLTSIEGIGEKTAIKIIKYYENVENLRNKKAEEISKNLNINITKVKKILEYLKTK